MLTAAELTAMQVVEESVQSSTAVIERYSLTADGMGGYSEAWSAVGTVTCDLWQVTRTDREKAGNGAQPIARGIGISRSPMTLTCKRRIALR